MASVILNPMQDGLDAASFARYHNYPYLHSLGYQWLSFYVGGNFGVSRATIEEMWAAGFVMMPNYERAADAALGGARAGRIAAQTAMYQLHNDLGFADPLVPVIFSGVDFGPRVDQFPALDAYHHALVDELVPRGQVGGAYGPRSYLSRLSTLSWWPQDWPLWHWGGDGYAIYSWAWCKQWFGRKPLELDPQHDRNQIGTWTDENTLLKPMRFWSGDGDTFPPAEVDEMKMTIFTILDPNQVTASNPHGQLDAVFVGWAEDGWALSVSWCDGWRAAALRGKPNPPDEMTINLGNLKGCVLDGGLPKDDRFHHWVNEDFFSTGPVGPKGDTGPTPHGTFAVTGTVTI